MKKKSIRLVLNTTSSKFLKHQYVSEVNSKNKCHIVLALGECHTYVENLLDSVSKQDISATPLLGASRTYITFPKYLKLCLIVQKL